MKNALKSIIVIILAALLIDQPAFAANKPGTGTLDYYNKNGIYYYNPSGDCETGGNTTGRATINGSTAAEKDWSGLTSLGFTDEQAAGIMGNMQHESVSFNPAQHEGSQYKKYWPMDLGSNNDKAYGLGLIQWSFGRRTNMYNYVKEQAPDLLKFFNNPETYSMKNGNMKKCSRIPYASRSPIMILSGSCAKTSLSCSRRCPSNWARHPWIPKVSCSGWTSSRRRSSAYSRNSSL